ncbi:MAG: DUF5009 domain-containing protein [Calditrichae bacterium]|nr:DUF5009 domain-containing protein [Calditrichia bacterium]
MESDSVKRIESIDVLRGITILVMIFVNDLAGVSGTPAWMRHVSAQADGMTFVDVVFPAFLFIVGMSMPFAIGKRLEQGGSLWEVWKHILIRTAGLLIIGVIMVNGETVSADGLINQQLLLLIGYAGVLLVWNKPHGVHKNMISRLRYAGLLFLVVFLFLYRGNDATGIIQLRTQWWGILGLIGWAYLIAAMFYIWLRNNITGLAGIVALLYCVFFADAVGFFENLTWVNSWVSIGGALGSHSAIVVSGILAGMMLRSPKSHSDRIRWAALYGILLAILAVMLHSLHDVHRVFTYNKILATPSWCLLSSAYTIWIWVIIYWLIDVKKWKDWAKIVEPAGTNALFAYILAPILMYLLELVAYLFGGYNFYYALGGSFAIGFWRSVVFAFFVTWLAGVLRKAGIWLKL